MPNTFEICSSHKNYSVAIAAGSSSDALKDLSSSSLLICDTFFKPLAESSGARFICIDALEESKSLEAMPALLSSMKKLGAQRSTRILALGGGIVQDAATFAASCYMRGLEWDYLPTTLLGMADSCVGGKSSINVDGYKNLAGNFHPPARVIVDPEFIATLEDAHVRAGLCEAAKICFAKGASAFQDYLSLSPLGIATGDHQAWERLVQASLISKKWFIEIDEHDQNERLLLNFGHTFGHAIESASQFRIPHGLAVGLGMLCAIRFCENQGELFPEGSPVRLLQRHAEELCAPLMDDPDSFALITMKSMLDSFEADKKHKVDQYALILPLPEGGLHRVFIKKSDSSAGLIFDSVAAVLQPFSQT